MFIGKTRTKKFKKVETCAGKQPVFSVPVGDFYCNKESNRYVCLSQCVVSVSHCSG
jgi:hypothetical protein